MELSEIKQRENANQKIKNKRKGDARKEPVEIKQRAIVKKSLRKKQLL
jgi:hypothetical protein